MKEIKQWAQLASSEPTYVITCADSDANDEVDPVTNNPGYTTWTYSLLGKATILIENGATYVAHCPDAHYNVATDSSYPNVSLIEPGAGSFARFLQQTTYPGSVNRCYITGKGKDSYICFG